MATGCLSGPCVRSGGSAGSGKPNIVYLDIDSTDPLHRKNFLTHEAVPFDRYGHANPARREHVACIGNPPFGTNAAKAIAFFNRAALFSDVIAFIVPKSFCKPSITNRLDLSFHLVAEVPMQSPMFTLDGAPADVPCVFQMWVHRTFDHCVCDVPRGKRTKIRNVDETADFTFVASPAVCDFAIRRVGVNAGRVFVAPHAEFSRSSHVFVSVRDGVQTELVLARIKTLELETCPLKTQTAGCPSISKSDLCRMYNERYPKQK